MSVGLRKAQTVSEVHVKGWFGVGYDLCVCGERVLSVQLGKRKERDEDEGEQEEARTVGGVHVGGWVDMGSDVCV